MPPAAVAFASGVVAKRAIERVVDDIYSLAKARANDDIAKWKARNKIDKLYSKVKEVRFVKTIWQFEKKVDIASFYCPTTVIMGNQRRQINDVDDFGTTDNVLILGTIGQGKSIFFRYLTSRELQRGRCIPLFIELRRIEASETLLNHLMGELSALGVPVNEKILRFLLEEGKVMLFLDAFDEVRESEQSTIVSQIESISRLYEKTRVFVSARPGTTLEGSVAFKNIKVARLQHNDYQHVVRRMVDDAKVASAIIKGVESQPNVKTLLDTPLIVALLVIRYKAEQSIPENIAEFYEGLFGLMMQRHDKLKAGYVRTRKSNLGDGLLENIFNSFCYLSRKANISSFKSSDVIKLFADAITVSDLEADADAVLRDISSVTCLILDDGGEYRFVHKSVQEFHAACFVRDRPDVDAEVFYTAMISKWEKWQQELRFLSVIDKHRFDMYYKIPSICSTLGIKSIDDASSWKPNADAVAAVFGNLSIVIESDAKNSLRHTSFMLSRDTGYIPSCWALPTSPHRVLVESLQAAFLSEPLLADEVVRVDNSVKNNISVRDFNISKILNSKKAGPILVAAAASAFDVIKKDLLETIARTRRKNAQKKIFDF